jgi:hypothetical protein
MKKQKLYITVDQEIKDFALDNRGKVSKLVNEILKKTKLFKKWKREKK